MQANLWKVSWSGVFPLLIYGSPCQMETSLLDNGPLIGKIVSLSKKDFKKLEFELK